MCLLEVKNISFSYGFKKPLIDRLSFRAGNGEYISVLGKNGSGKSTLVGLITGQLKPDSGEILYKGKDIGKMKKREKACEIAVIYQNTGCRFPFQCYQIVAMGLYPHQSRFSNLSKDDASLIKNVMEATDTLRFAEKTLDEISGGEAQRVFLARALAQQPRLLLLDEAMSGLDIAARLKMAQLLKEGTKSGHMSVIAVHHDLSLAFSLSDRILAMKDGKLTADGTPSELLSESFFLENFGVRSKITDGRFYITDAV